MVGVELVHDAYFSSMFSKVTAHLTVHVGELGAGMAEEGVVSAVRAWVTSEPATGSCNSLVPQEKGVKKKGETISATVRQFSALRWPRWVRQGCRVVRWGRHPHFYLVGNHLQVQVGTVSRDAEVGTVSRHATVAQHKQHDSSDEEHAERNQSPQPQREDL